MLRNLAKWTCTMSPRHFYTTMISIEMFWFPLNFYNTSPLSLHDLLCATNDGFRSQASRFLLLRLPIVCSALSGVKFCLDFGPFFFLLLFPSQVIFLYLFIYYFIILQFGVYGLFDYSSTIKMTIQKPTKQMHNLSLVLLVAARHQVN